MIVTTYLILSRRGNARLGLARLVSAGQGGSRMTINFRLNLK